VGVLQRFERRLEGLVNGAFAKAFKSEVQPVEIAAALQRECTDRAAIVGKGRTMVPNDFTVELGQHDYDRLQTYSEPLGSELAAMVEEYGQEQSYSFLGPVEIHFNLVPDLDTGMFRITSRGVAGVVGMTPAPPMAGPAQAMRQPAGPRHGGGPSFLEINGSVHPLNQPVTVLGRGTDVDLRIDDPSVSRRHAEVRIGPSPMIADLGSTNGIVVNGQHTTQAPLQDGSTIVLGSTTIVFRADEG